MRWARLFLRSTNRIPQIRAIVARKVITAVITTTMAIEGELFGDNMLEISIFIENISFIY
uniref:Uncharacterized protein n=1 Tax=uncultured bacterium contig00094 TaxID=1181565 RepID=A0A806K1Q2_9BACT|nr:hypothetical protein [uncultured bacterium contig00094]